MKVTGLNKDLLLINNPIWVLISDLQNTTRYVEITLTNITDPSRQISTIPLRIYPATDRDGKLHAYYNLQDVLKGNFPLPQHPQETLVDTDLGTNYAKFHISFMEVLNTGTNPRGRRTRSSRGRTSTFVEGISQTADVVSFTRTFIRGGRKTMQTNLSLQVGQFLIEGEKIPRWGGYPISAYYISAGKRIMISPIIPTELADQRQIVGCDPLYIRFLNTKGGYSYWLFESYSEDMQTKSGKSIRSHLTTFHTGLDISTTLKAETRVPRRYYALVEALIKSPEVYVHKMYGQDWAKVRLLDGDFEPNNYETVQKVNIDLEVETNEKPSVLW